MAETFETFVAKERHRLGNEQMALLDQRAAIDDKLLAIEREFQAIEAYEAAKTGKAPARATGKRSAASRKGSKRDGIMQVLKANAGGLTRGELLEKMGLKGNKSGEMSVSNALTALSKSNQVRRDGGKYFAA